MRCAVLSLSRVSASELDPEAVSAIPTVCAPVLAALEYSVSVTVLTDVFPAVNCPEKFLAFGGTARLFTCVGDAATVFVDIAVTLAMSTDRSITTHGTISDDALVGTTVIKALAV